MARVTWSAGGSKVGTNLLLDYVSLTDVNPQTIVGVVTFSSTPKTDAIAEATPNAGITIDGLLCKDGVIPNSGYPSAFLTDGSRDITGNPKIKNAAPELLLEDTDSSPSYGRIIWDDTLWGFKFLDESDSLVDLYVYLLSVASTVETKYIDFNNAGGRIRAMNAAGAYIRFQTEWGGLKTVLQAVDGECQIPRAGDIITLSGVGYHHRLPDTRPAAPVAGDSRYDPTTDTLEYRTAAGAWSAH